MEVCRRWRWRWRVAAYSSRAGWCAPVPDGCRVSFWPIRRRPLSGSNRSRLLISSSARLLPSRQRRVEPSTHRSAPHVAMSRPLRRAPAGAPTHHARAPARAAVPLPPSTRAFAPARGRARPPPPRGRLRPVVPPPCPAAQPCVAGGRLPCISLTGERAPWKFAGNGGRGFSAAARRGEGG